MGGMLLRERASESERETKRDRERQRVCVSEGVDEGAESLRPLAACCRVHLCHVHGQNVAEGARKSEGGRESVRERLREWLNERQRE